MSSAISDANPSALRPMTRERTLLGHPRGLLVLFLTELWERFSYFGLRALLIFYLTKHFLLGDQRAYATYGAYMSLVYVTPVVGGWIADRWLGARRAVIFGGILIATGHFLIALSEGPRGTSFDSFLLALAFVVVGTGFLKANVSVLVGTLYAREDMRRDPAYSLFYMGINIGGALGPIVCGILGETLGWSWGFGAAGLGMIGGLAVFIALRRWLDETAAPEASQDGAASLKAQLRVYAATPLAVLLVWALLQREAMVGYVLLCFSALMTAYLLRQALFVLGPSDRQKLLALLFLIGLNPLFWAYFEQVGSSLSVFTDRSVDRSVLGVVVPSPVFQSLNSLFIITLAPLFAGLWAWLGRRRREPGAPRKFAIAFLLLGLGFLVLVAGAGTNRAALSPMLPVILLYLLHAMGELCLAPVGLAAVSALSMPRMAGLLMGCWFLATAGGNFLASVIARLTGSEGHTMLDVYATLGWSALALGTVVFAASGWINALLAGSSQR